MPSEDDYRMPQNEEAYNALVRQNHREMILQHSLKEGEPIPRMYAVPITEMNRDELMAVINSMSKRLSELDKHYVHPRR